MCAEAAAEARVGGDAAPASRDGGGAREGRRQRGQAEEDLREQVVVLQRPRRRRVGAAAEGGHRLEQGAAEQVEYNIFFFSRGDVE